MTFWQYSALVSDWMSRQSSQVTAPSAEDYYAEKELLRARNDPTIRLH